MNEFGQALQPQPPGMGAPRSPQEQQERQNGWTQTLREIQESPRALMTLLTIGNALIQNQAPGTNTMQHFSGAIGQGLDYNSRYMTLQREIEERAAKQQLEGRKVGVDERGAAVREGQLKLEQEKAPSDIDLTKARAEEARANARYAGKNASSIGKPGAQQQLIEMMAQAGLKLGKFETIEEARLHYGDQITLQAKSKPTEQQIREYKQDLYLAGYDKDEVDTMVADVFGPSPTASQASGTVDHGGYTPGQVYDGYRYNGNGYNDPKNWTQVK